MVSKDIFKTVNKFEGIYAGQLFPNEKIKPGNTICFKTKVMQRMYQVTHLQLKMPL